MKRLTLIHIRDNGNGKGVLQIEDLFILDRVEEKRVGAELEKAGYHKTELEPEEGAYVPKPNDLLYLMRNE
jgi:hypothetical protein